MRRPLVIALCSLALLAAQAKAADRGTTVSCGSSIGASAKPRSSGSRVVLGVVSVPPAYLPQVVRSGAGDPQPWWSKSGLLIAAGAPVVTVSVPARLRHDVTLTWGDATGETLRFPRCVASRGPLWSAYAGGFLLRSRRTCVTLDVSVGTRSQAVRFGLGRRC